VTDDPFDLDRFKTAQAGVIDQALAELRAGRKQSHWMWFVFPQIQGLGFSAMAQTYGIVSLAEARAYLADPELGHRLRSCLEALLAHAGRPAESILGGVDAVKLRSCLTLFRAAAPNDQLFQRALDVFFAGEADEATLQRLA
jgi:uncharacterized protein (DUF1810 family)